MCGANQTPWVLRTILTVEHDGRVKLWRFKSTGIDRLITAKPCGEMWCNAQNHFQQPTDLRHTAEEKGWQKWPAVKPRLRQNSIRIILTFLHRNALTMPKNLLICEMITGRHCLNKTMQHNKVMLHWSNILPLKGMFACSKQYASISFRTQTETTINEQPGYWFENDCSMVHIQFNGAWAIITPLLVWQFFFISLR